MRHVMQTTFQGLTKHPKFTPEFFTFLFMMTLFQWAISNASYRFLHKPHFVTLSPETQVEDLTVIQNDTMVLNIRFPHDHIYFKNKIIEDKKSQLNFLLPFLKTESFLKIGREGGMQSIDPDPSNPGVLSSISLKDQEGIIQKTAKTPFEEEKIKAHVHRLYSQSKESVLDLKKNASKARNETIMKQFQEIKKDHPSLEITLMSLEQESPFKAFYHYTIDSKSRLLAYWMQLIAPHENVIEEEKPYRRALVELLLSNNYLSSVNEVNWLEDPENDEETATRLSQHREEAFYDYLRLINWEETEFKNLFLCPQTYGQEDFHQVEEEAFLYAYEIVRRCAPGFCEEGDFCVR